MIAIEDQATAGTFVHPGFQGHGLSVLTSAAILTRIGRIDSHILPASFFRFAGQFAEKFRPRGVMNAFRQTMGMRHPVDMQVFYADDPEALNNAMAFLMREVLAPEGDTLMHAGNGFSVLPAFRCAVRKLGMLALHFRQGFLFFAEKARVGDLAPIREGRERLQPDINPDLFCSLRQTFRLDLTRKRGIPFSGSASVDGERFEPATQWAMQDDLDMSNARGVELALGVDREARLGIGEAIIAPLAPETRIARFFPCLAPSEKGFQGQINTDSHILQDLRVNRVESGVLLFEDRIGGLLLIARQSFAILLISRLALFKQVIVEPTALFKRVIELCFLLFGGVYPILKHFTHVSILWINGTGVKHPAFPHVKCY